MPAGIHTWQYQLLQEGELLHGYSFFKILPGNIHAEVFAGDRGALVTGGRKEHSGRMIIFVVDDVTLVESVILIAAFFLLRDQDLIPSLRHHLFLYLRLFIEV